MDIIELNTWWKFNPPDLTEGDEIQCPECRQFSSHKDWNEGEIFCEECGEHFAVVCPKCNKAYDSVGQLTFNSRR